MRTQDDSFGRTRAWLWLAALACPVLGCAESNDPLERASSGTGGDSDGKSDEPGKDPSDGSDESSSGGEPEPEACVLPPIDALSVCPDDAPELGDAEGMQVEALEFRWAEFLPACNTTVAEPIFFRVGEDVISLGASFERSETAFALFGGFVQNGRVLLDATLPFGEHGSILAAPLRHTPTTAPTNVASLGLPISPQTQVEAGCVGLRPFVDGDAEGELGTLHVATRTVVGKVSGQLSLELVRVGDVELDDDDLDVAIEHARRIYEDAGAGPIDVSITRVEAPDGSVFPSMGPELAALRTRHQPQDSASMVVFLIADFVEPGLAGIAAGLPGPNGIPGTGASGVVVAVEPHRFGDGGLAATIFGETLAHEVGHQLGLFHTSERDASNHDLVEDTARCTLEMDADGDGTLTADECPDGQNLMFWGGSELPQVELSAAQADVLTQTTIAR